MLTSMMRGAAAGAAGTTALNAVTYLDMLLRARPASSTPERTVRKLADLNDVPIPGDEDQQQNRVSSAGALMGLVTGVATGAALGTLRILGRGPLVVSAATAGVVALAGANGPMAALGISDPREWSAGDWVSDILPHLAYGLVAAAAFRAMSSAR
jgi:hypothetical protein